MNINWEQKWLSFDHRGATVFLQGALPSQFLCTVVELHLVQQQSMEATDVPLPV
jgi:hypothetical protein